MPVPEPKPAWLERAIAPVTARAVAAIAAFNRWRLPPRDAPHPMLTGLNRPMTEELTLTELVVEGDIPSELDGRYVRIGPNPVDPDPRTYHFFTGDGMLHGIRIAGGRALWYRNRWIRSELVAKARGIEPAPGPRHIFDTVNTNVVPHAGRGYALVEAGSTPVRFGEELEDQAYDDFEGTLPGSFTAHPRRDPATGELHAICYEANDPKRVRYVVVDPRGKVRRAIVIPVEDGPLIHDCAITARFVIVMDLPLTLSLRTVLSGHGFPYRWNPRHRARIGLLPRDGEAEDIIWAPIEPCFAFHIANAHDRPDGRVAMDVIAYDFMFAAGDTLDESARRFERWTLCPETRTVVRETLDGTPQEFPRIDERRAGLPYRYAYTLVEPGALDDGAGKGEAQLFRHDLETGERAIHRFGPGRAPGEFVFVPRAAEVAEGDGWLIGLVIEPDGERSALEILDARDLPAAPLATIRLPHRVPVGIHGAWLPNMG
jgi:carotenoid cleavage dioxygenase-like enzyme